MTAGERIKKLRKEHHMTQEELGNIIGVKKAAIQKYEKGTVQNIKRASLLKLAEVLDTTPEYLLGWDKPDNVIEVNIEDLVNIPILASVSAGMGTLADSINSHAIGYETASKHDLSAGDKYVFMRVTGDSMYPIFIEGDLVLVRVQESVDSGSYAVVIIDDCDGVIKRVVYGKDFVELHSVNPMYAPRRFEGKELERIRIFGLVKECKRKF